LQCVAVWCSVVQCGAVWCSVVQCGAVWCSVLQCLSDSFVTLAQWIRALFHCFGSLIPWSGVVCCNVLLKK